MKKAGLSCCAVSLVVINKQTFYLETRAELILERFILCLLVCIEAY